MCSKLTPAVLLGDPTFLRAGISRLQTVALGNTAGPIKEVPLCPGPTRASSTLKMESGWRDPRGRRFPKPHHSPHEKPRFWSPTLE